MADKGYHDNRLLARCAEWEIRTYLPERQQKNRCWTNKPAEQEAAYRANRRRVRAAKGRLLNRWRSERCERTFAHICETGGGRRSWLRGMANVSKVYVIKCAAYNLGLLLRKVWGLRKPRNWEEGAMPLFGVVLSLLAIGLAWVNLKTEPASNGFYSATELLVLAVMGAAISVKLLFAKKSPLFKRAASSPFKRTFITLHLNNAVRIGRLLRFDAHRKANTAIP